MANRWATIHRGAHLVVSQAQVHEAVGVVAREGGQVANIVGQCVQHLPTDRAERRKRATHTRMAVRIQMARTCRCDYYQVPTLCVMWQ